ncbi:MAG: small subunit ribosomal protein [Clostridiales bacterium]|jgi:small subunit ribosomal protein S4|nr:30S ribosomal protein S4 [Eubacteriales bacterium]MDD3197661.1 30S ribosomal protein S4 [Eubacteriales bacterium]MDD3503008.1 30S ribosomal protein S4 [Eubacteriales bacterium]MDD4682869.1 30S ribosomal protein S4 [Eubacteriales bacterium]MDN5313787.1 small subunit ribosomal protein [Clostridiales bacterium]
MARYTDASCRLCRREGEKLFLKGQRCYTGKCALARRSFAPGQHGQGRKKTSEYGTQIREKQKAKRFYGVMETQFRNTYDKASRMKGKPGENLLMLLEMRFDNIIYRMGLAASRAEARQLVTHGHFTVNGKKADIPSMQLAVGDVVEVRETSRKSAKFQELNGRNVPAWLTFNDEALKGTVAQIPGRDDVDLEVKETLIVELYSK